MIKKILFTFLIFCMSYAVQSQITFTTTSSSGIWSPNTVTKSGAILTWTAASNADFPGQTVNLNDPIFDFSLNINELPIVVTVTSSDGFSGLTELDFWNDDGLESRITIIDVSDATALTELNTRYNNLTSLDVTQNTALTTLTVRGNNQLLGVLDISNNTQLTFIQADVTQINSISLANNSLLDNVILYNAELTSTILDQIVIDLDNHGLSNGNLEIIDNPGSLTTASLTAYNNLITKNWTIDVAAPAVDTESPVVGVLNAATNILQTSLTLNWTAATDNIGVTNYRVFQDNVPIATIGNVLTFDVTGLTASTTYNFFIRALDNEGNESLNSNTIQATTLNTSGSTFTFTTTSSSGIWSPNTVTKSGAILTWAAASNADFPGQTVNLNDPVFDFSLNINELPIVVTVTSSDGFNGLTELDFWNDNGLESQITVIDVSSATALTELNTRYNNLTSLDVTQNTALTTLTVRGNNQLSSVLDISNNTQLNFIQADVTQLSTISFSNNTLLTDVRLFNAQLTTVALDQIVIDLDNHGLSNGNLQIVNNVGALTSAALIAYNNLITKNWTIDVPAPAPAPGPEIDVTGNSVSIVSGNVPNILDDTDFGQVAIGAPVTKTFTISNIGSSDLTINFFFTSGTYFTFLPPGGGGIVLVSGASTTIDATFDPSATGVQTGTITIDNTDPDESPYIINLTAEGIAASLGTIDVQGNSTSITNGDLTPDVADDTDFGPVLMGTTKTTTYTIFNNHLTDNLTIDNINLVIGADVEFTTSSLPTFPATVLPGANITFDVIFAPTTTTTTENYDAIVNVDHSDTATGDPFQFGITGQGADVVVSGDIMITQYYEGTTNSKWIEIKNISGAVIPAGTYFLALYNNASIPNIEIQAPSANESIPEMAIDEVLLFKNLASPSNPSIGNLGSATQIDASASGVCNFDGNDVILISTSNDVNSYGNRQDIIGTVPGTPWGTDVAYIRGGVNEVPEANFNAGNWIIISVGADVDVADPTTNIALGTQDRGIAVWTGSWSNSIKPDKTRNVEITSGYTAANGTFTSKNLLINSSLNFDNGTTNSVVVYGNLNITGSFIIGDTESLVMYDEYGVGTITGNITKIENSTIRNNAFDFTYWSSPIANANIATVFTGVDPARIFLYDPLQTSVSTAPDYYNNWLVASGTTITGKGYAAEGPTGTTGIHNISFVGAPNTGPVPVELAMWADGDTENDYNFIGNPYPSAVNLNDFILSNSRFDGTIYLWTHATPISHGSSGDFISSDYAYYNLGGGTNPSGGPLPTNNLGSSQGFFVRATSNGFANFSNSMRMIEANDQFFKLDNSKNKITIAEKDRVWLNINSNQGGSNQLLVAFMEKATEAADRGYDALTYKNSDNVLSFYSIIESDKYVIQGLPTFNESQTVVLGFDTNVAPRTLTISIHKMEGALKTSEIYLVDNLLGITHDLKVSDYEFEQTTTGEFKSRFTLQFAGQALDVDDIVLGKNDFIVSKAFENLKITAKKNVSTIKVYDLLGRLLINKKPNKQSFELKTGNIKVGTILIIEATLENGATVSKKTIKY